MPTQKAYLPTALGKKSPLPSKIKDSARTGKPPLKGIKNKGTHNKALTGK